MIYLWKAYIIAVWEKLEANAAVGERGKEDGGKEWGEKEGGEKEGKERKCKEAKVSKEGCD